MSDPDFKEGTKQHWKYVEGVLKTHGVSDRIIKIVGFHYRTAMAHGYKHGIEDVKVSKK